MPCESAGCEFHRKQRVLWEQAFTGPNNTGNAVSEKRGRRMAGLRRVIGRHRLCVRDCWGRAVLPTVPHREASCSQGTCFGKHTSLKSSFQWGPEVFMGEEFACYIPPTSFRFKSVDFFKINFSFLNSFSFITWWQRQPRPLLHPTVLPPTSRCTHASCLRPRTLSPWTVASAPGHLVSVTVSRGAGF